MMASADGEARPDLGAVIRLFLPGLLTAFPQLPQRKQRLLQRMALCRTGALGMTWWECSECGYATSVPLACGDRHCPSCQAGRSQQWLQNQTRALLPVPYFHVVFTLPRELHALLRRNQETLYALLFESAAESLLEFASQRLKGTPGITAVLHTWGQRLNYHPHLHCIVTGGALSVDGQTWTGTKTKRYLFPEAPLAALFRGKFLAGLRDREAQLDWPGGTSFAALRELYKEPWHIYLKRPFGGPQQALAYLANYTHRVAISNGRLQAINPQAGTVRFRYRDYADASRIKSEELPGVKFLLRFCQHLLPRGFTRIRHYGLLANNRRKRDIAQARLRLLTRRTVDLLVELHRPPENLDWPCPRCRSGTLHTAQAGPARPAFRHCRPP
jgi:hypothetical protein